MAKETKERFRSAARQRHAACQKARKELFLMGPVTFTWMCSPISDATSRLILVARAFVAVGDSPRLKLTRKHWDCARITDKDTHPRVTTKIKLECQNILPDLPSLGSVLTPLLKLVLGEPPLTKVRRRDPHSIFVGLRTSAGPAMEAAAAVLPIGRTLTRGALTSIRTAPLPRPVRAKPRLDTDGHVVFCQHE